MVTGAIAAICAIGLAWIVVLGWFVKVVCAYRDQSELFLTGGDQATVYRMGYQIGVFWTCRLSDDDADREFQRATIEDNVTCRVGFDDYAQLTRQEAQDIIDILRPAAERAFERERPFWAEVKERERLNALPTLESSTRRRQRLAWEQFG